MADMSAVQILWHVEGASNLRGIVVDPRIAKLGQAARSNLTMATFYAGFGGICIALFVYNLALWGALRHRFQLAYCRSEEHTSELQSLMRISYAVFCLKNKNK